MLTGGNVQYPVRSWGVRIGLWKGLIIILLFSFFSWGLRSSHAEPISVLSDDELEEITGQGFYFLLDLSLEAFTEGDTPPQVIFNPGTPLVLPTAGQPSVSGPVGSISLSGNAQSNVSSLINVIGSASVINIGINIVNITNSSNDTINTTNLNLGNLGSGGNLPLPLLP